jgi:hypothetical protein
LRVALAQRKLGAVPQKTGDAASLKPSIEPMPFAVATFTFLLAGFVKGVIGLGLPTVSMGLLRGWFSEQTFRRVYFVGLPVLGAHLASRALI